MVPGDSLSYTLAMARQLGDHNAKRIEIAEAACKAILKLGIVNTSLNDISRELGYTTGVLRHYFQDKEDLLRFTKNYLFDRMFRQMKGAADKAEGIDRLIAMAMENLPASGQSNDMWRLLAAFNGRAIGDSTLLRLQHRRYAKGAANYISEIKRLQTQGVISPAINPDLEGVGICAFVEGLAAHIIMAPKARPRSDWQKLVKRYVDRMFA